MTFSPGDARQRIDDFFGQAVAEILVLLVAAHVLERQHDDRRLFSGWRRRHVIERGSQLAHRLEAIEGPLGEAAPHDVVHGGRRIERRRIVAQQRADTCAVLSPAKARLPDSSS